MEPAKNQLPAPPTPSILDAAIRDCLMRLSSGETLSNFMATLSDRSIPSGALTSVLAKTVSQNAFYEHCFHKLDLLQRMKAEWTGLEEKGPKTDQTPNTGKTEKILGLLGTTVTRNTLSCLRMRRVAGEGIPAEEGVKINISLQNDLKFALATEEYAEEHGVPHQLHAYLAGLHYDWLTMSFRVSNALTPSLKTAIEEAWTLSLQIANVACSISSVAPNFRHSQCVFAGAMAIGLGKAFMNFAHPESLGEKSWKSFNQSCESSGYVGRMVMNILERRSFPITHNEYAFLCIGFLNLLPSPTRWGVLFSANPEVIFSAEKDTFLLSVILKTAMLWVVTSQKSSPPYVPLECIRWLEKNGIEESIWRPRLA